MQDQSPKVTIIGGGPAGLMAAEVLSAGGAAVTLHEKMPTLGRKFLMAGRGGLNLTHSEPTPVFLKRYGAARATLTPILEAFAPKALSAWAEGLGQPVFTGSSGRVFPKALKASPLLRAWMARLAAQGVTIRTRSTWTGWDADGALVFEGADGAITTERPDATILALGGASWPRLGSDGGWAQILADRGVAPTPFRPSNVGFEVAWSEVFRTRFAGRPLKAVGLSFAGLTVRGEAMVTAHGLEGGGIYALSAPMRDAIAKKGEARLRIDLRPDLPWAQIAAKLDHGRAGDAVANRLRKALNLSPLEINLLREGLGVALPAEAGDLAAAIKSVPLTLTGVRPMDRAISTAGGVGFEALDEGLMLKALPGVWAVGEMLDWEAPTGGYLLQACFATGVWAAKAVLGRGRQVVDAC
jgi:uncharacterized flavoprotein (TIGR03862 family)